MRLTRSSLILAVIGVLFLAGAAVVRFAVLPSVSKLPSDLNTTQRYSGTYSGLNPAALSGNSGVVALANAASTASRRYQASSVQGNTAVVTRTLQRSVGGVASPQSEVHYAVDRTTFESTSAPSGTSGIVPSKGLIFTLPLHPATDAGYRLWDETTAAAFPLTYKGTATVRNRDTYRYQSVAQGKVGDPASLGLPTSVPRAQLTRLGPDLANLLPAPLRSQLPAILAALPNTVPLTWTSSTDTSVWADTTTGAPIRVQSTQKISGGVSVLGQTLSIPLGTLTLSTTAASEQSTASDASSNASTLNLVGTVLPLALLGLGIVLLVVALVLAIRAGRRGTAAPAEPGARTPTPV